MGVLPRRLWLVSMLSLLLLVESLGVVRAEPMVNDAFRRTWERTDKPVADLVVNRTWMWGGEAFTGAVQERYDDAPGGTRTVQYFDKSRMEINHDPNVPADSPWHVTNGLLVVEMMTGQLQIGDAARETREPARVNVAGDQGGQPGVTYGLDPVWWTPQS